MTQHFAQNSSEFVIPCLVVETSDYHLREFLGLGGARRFVYLAQRFARFVQAMIASFHDMSKVLRTSDGTESCYILTNAVPFPAFFLANQNKHSEPPL